VVVVAESGLAESAALVEGDGRIVGMHGQRNLPIAGRSSRGERCQQELAAVSLVLKRRLQRNAELWRALVYIRETNALRKQAHPARSDVVTVDHRHQPDVGGASPILCIDADLRSLQDLDRTESCGRRIPQGDVQPAPEAVLILDTQLAKPEHGF